MTAFLGNILGGLLKFIYDLVATIGVEPERFSYYAMAVILTTIVFKLLLLPLSLQQSKSTKKLNEIQPEIKKIQDKYKSDPQTQQAKMAQVYKDHKYNPASGCLLIFIQFPIIIAFFKVMREPVTYAFKDPALYENMNKAFLWVKDLGQPDPILWGLPLLAAVTTYFQSVTMTSAAPTDPQAQATQKMMNIFLPAMIFVSAKSFPAGLTLYWTVSNIFTIVYQVISNRQISKIKEEK